MVKSFHLNGHKDSKLRTTLNPCITSLKQRVTVVHLFNNRSLSFPDLQWELKINRPAFPTQQDFMGSISAILRIQDVYNISARALADGELQDGKSSGGLGADECYELGVVSHSLEYYEDVIDWMREAQQRMRPPYNYSGALTKIDVLEYLAWAEYKVRDKIVTK